MLDGMAHVSGGCVSARRARGGGDTGGLSICGGRV